MSVFKDFGKRLKTAYQTSSNIVDVLITLFDNVNAEIDEKGLEKTGNYSTDEQEVGTWINGETIFQKTIEIGALTNSTAKTVAHGITGISNIIEISGFYNNPTTHDTIADQYAESTDSIATVATPTNIIVYVHGNFTGFTNCYITIKYTKTA